LWNHEEYSVLLIISNQMNAPSFRL
jgi:hypothetical protein